jgi:hypothetical protein
MHIPEDSVLEFCHQKLLEIALSIESQVLVNRYKPAPGVSYK